MIHYTEFNFEKLGSWKTVQLSKNKEVYNVPCSFDIETTNFTVGKKKYATMYIWQFCLGLEVIYGRTWQEFHNFIYNLNYMLSLRENRKLICYVHNLGFEFQFIKKHFEIKKLFARKPRQPMYFEAENIIFKDSLILSGLSLKRTLEEANVEHAKMDGDLDYSLYRHSKTPLTDKELGYCENDVLGLNEYIYKEMSKNDNDITKIPTTKTGYVRRYTRKICFSYDGYRERLQTELITEPKIFTLLMESFSGAYTHANFLKVGIEYDNVASKDFTSSYPSVMLRHKYPRSRFVECKVTELKDLLDKCIHNCCIMRITLYNVEPKNVIHPLSKHRCKYDKDTLQEDNGKIVRSAYVHTCMTSVDFLDICKMYNFTAFELHEFYMARAGYLPKPIIETILSLYRDKCLLKGVEGKEDVYLVAKGMLNSLYGMCVTNPIAPEIDFNDETKEWTTKEDLNLKHQLLKIWKSKQTFLNYAWGVFVTAWARHELYDGILAVEKDFIYSDTDSIKLTNADKYTNYFEEYNKRCTKEINKCLSHYNISTNKYIPKDKPLGVWDDDGTYEKFKTLGAKKYAFIKKGKFGYTVAGLPKVLDTDRKTPLKWILEDNPTGRYGMDYFDIDLEVPKDYSCKLCSTYVDEPFESLVLIDYLDNPCEVSELSCLNLSDCAFTINFSNDFYDFILGEDNPNGELIKQILSRKVGMYDVFG